MEPCDTPISNPNVSERPQIPHTDACLYITIEPLNCFIFNSIVLKFAHEDSMIKRAKRLG